MHKTEYIYIDTVKDFLDLKTYFSSNEFIFRGVQDRKFELIPTLYRSLFEDEKRGNDDLENIKNIFFKEDDTFSYLTEKIKKDLNLEDLYVQQHYGIPTRFLDFTYDMNIALMFAVGDFYECCFSTKKCDAAIYVLKKTDFIDEETNDTQLLTDLITKYNTDDCYFIKQDVRKANYPLKPSFYDFDYNTILDRRIKKQKACLIVFPHAFEKNLKIDEDKIFAKIIIRECVRRELYDYVHQFLKMEDLK